MFTSTLAVCRLRGAELLSGVPLSKELLRRVRTSTSLLSRPPCLVVVLVGDRPDSIRYIEKKRRAGAECGIEVRLVQLSAVIRQDELHRALAAVNSDVGVDGVILQLPLPPHLRARPALFHIHPGKDVDGLHPLNTGNLFLQDRSSLWRTRPSGSSASRAPPADQQEPAIADAMPLLLYNGASGAGASHRLHEPTFFVPCTALAICTILFSYLNRTPAFAHGLPPDHSQDVSDSDSLLAPPFLSSPSDPRGSPAGGRSTNPPRRDLHAVIVNKSVVVGVPTAALLQRAGGFTVTMCSRSNSLDAVRRLARQADVLITAYGAANVFDRSFVRDGAIVVDAAINELPQGTVEKGAPAEVGCTAHKKRLCGDVDVESASAVAAAITKTPGGVGPLTVSHLMSNVLKAYQLRDAHPLHNDDFYRELLKIYGTFDTRKDEAPHLAVPLTAASQPTTTDAGVVRRTTAAVTLACAAAGAPDALQTPLCEAVELCAGGTAVVEEEKDDLTDNEDADNESYHV
ncbi:hypothetical protein JKF63_04364 [Porcisia hertigi]|uniref:Methenyltetrahydrofolate cyclohydrolase n=1 Tax=Porcisia hertigi TaxID=2761500 RepID=A0A836INN0_9TRYP|nr:hypothetical protein JKF63_04364 [Porcisia hertigi]